MQTSEVLKVCSDIEHILNLYGNINFINKEDLYSLISYVRECFEIDPNIVFNVPKFLNDNFRDIINYEKHNFNDTKIGGLLVKNTYPEKSFIVYNTSKDPLSSIFDLTHEIIHFLLHPENRQHYISSSCAIDNLEWQANEGAAELLVPYKNFIPLFVENIKGCTSRSDYIDILNDFSKKYVVSTAVLDYRVSSLKYEIFQYEQGVSVDDIKLLSKKDQEENGIFISSYSDKFNNKKDLKSIISETKLNYYAQIQKLKKY